LAGDGTNAIVVVRVSQCQRVVIDGGRAHAATVSQIGVSLTAPDGSAGPDPTADINNYTLAYSTNDNALAKDLKRAGVDARHDPQLSYDLVAAQGSSEGDLSISARHPNGFRLTAEGDVVFPSAGPVPFIASWWGVAGSRNVVMRTVFGAIRFGTASFTLHAVQDSQLAEIIGDTELEFDLLDSFNKSLCGRSAAAARRPRCTSSKPDEGRRVNPARRRWASVAGEHAVEVASGMLLCSLQPCPVSACPAPRGSSQGGR
jgi:hypothetical protein